MKKLKTLKDIENKYTSYPGENEVVLHINVAIDGCASVILSKDLKESVKEWIKELEKPKKYYDYEPVIDWIKHFFNLEESDLE